MMSSSAHRKLYAISLAALFFSLSGNATTWIRGEVERGRIDKTARQAAATAEFTRELANKTNDGLICLLQRAKLTVDTNPRLDTNQKKEIKAYYDREIKILGGPLRCEAGDGRDGG